MAKTKKAGASGLQIEYLPARDLVPYAKNARLHSAEQVTKIAESIRAYGFNNPVLVDHAGGIIAGHGRVLAAAQIGLKDVPCVVLAHLSETQKRAYIIADNRLGEIGGGWDVETLALEVEDLRLDESISLDSLGFNSAELDAIFDSIAEAVNPPADVRDVEVVRVPVGVGIENNPTVQAEPPHGFQGTEQPELDHAPKHVNMPPPENADKESDFKYKQKHGVIIICDDVAEQEKTYNEMVERGYECRVVSV
jgi:hypothetical protein